MLPAEHFGTVEKRRWYKVRWTRNPAGLKDVAGKIDLVREEDFSEIKDYVEVLQELEVAKCTAGIRLGYGKTSGSEIEKWIDENKTK